MSDREILRRTIARELDTINQYEADAAAADDPRVRAFLEHLAHEEKEHVAEGMAMLHLFDRRQAQLATKRPHFLEEGAAAKSAKGPDAAAGQAAAASTRDADLYHEPATAIFRPDERFTVGSLRPAERRATHTPPETFGLDRRPGR